MEIGILKILGELPIVIGFGILIYLNCKVLCDLADKFMNHIKRQEDNTNIREDIILQTLKENNKCMILLEQKTCSEIAVLESLVTKIDKLEEKLEEG